MKPTMDPAVPSVTIVCAWCRRDTGGVSTTDPRAIVGLCQDHVTAFFSRVDALLGSLAELRGKSSKSNDVPAEPPARDGDRVESIGELLRRQAGLTLCDACLGTELGWSPARVADEAEALAPAEFLRDRWRCARCGARGIVTRARGPRTRLVEHQAA